MVQRFVDCSLSVVIAEIVLSGYTEIGDYVEQDEEIATIETDKVWSLQRNLFHFCVLIHYPQIDVAVNAPEPGTIKEFLANEEDSVTVGQDLLKLELGRPPKGGEKQSGGSKPKAPASDNQATSSDPRSNDEDGTSEQESKPQSPSPERKPEPPKEQSKPDQPPQELSAHSVKSSNPRNSQKMDSKSNETASLGNRDERRVGVFYKRTSINTDHCHR